MVRTWCRGQWCLQEALRGGRWWAAAEDYLRALCDWLLCCHGNRRLLPPATPLLPVSTINLWNKDLGINSTMNQSSFWISKTDKEYAQSQTEKKISEIRRVQIEQNTLSVIVPEHECCTHPRKRLRLRGIRSIYDERILMKLRKLWFLV